MAVAYRTKSDTGWQTGTSYTITKPTGLAVDDLMFLWVVGGGNNVGAVSGFTAYPGFIAPAGSASATYLYYKYADSSDVAASNFTGTFDTGGALYFAAIITVTGATNLATNFVRNSSYTTTNTATPSLTGITPDSRGDSLLIQLWHGAPNVASTASYAIATSNPSWTEIIDASNASSTGVAVAYATRPEVTATGNFSCAGGDASSDWVGVILAIAPGWTAIATETVTVSDTEKANPSIKIQESISCTDTESATTQRVWTNSSKSSSTWTNEIKD